MNGGSLKEGVSRSFLARASAFVLRGLAKLARSRGAALRPSWSGPGTELISPLLGVNVTPPETTSGEAQKVTKYISTCVLSVISSFSSPVSLPRVLYSAYGILDWVLPWAPGPSPSPLVAI